MRSYNECDKRRKKMNLTAVMFVVVRFRVNTAMALCEISPYSENFLPLKVHLEIKLSAFAK